MYLIRDGQGTITAIRVSETNFFSELRIGDEVVSNGVSWIPAGTKGRVVGFSDTQTTPWSRDVVHVLWEGREFKVELKYKHLDQESLFAMNRARLPQLAD